MSPPDVDMSVVDIAMTDCSPDPLFDEALDAIQNVLSEDDRRAFRHYADAPSMLHEVRALCTANQKEHQRLLACSRKMAIFADAFAPYFDILSTFVQIQPDWLGWFWGSIRLVFKVGSDHVLFLERAAEMFEAVAHSLPQYRQCYDTCRKHFDDSTRQGMCTMMSYVYADIVQFCLELYQMFLRNPTGAGLRHRIGFVTSVLWRPLDSRFAQLQQRLGKHREWFEAEMAVQNFELLAQHRKETLEYLRTQGEVHGEVEAERMSRRMRRVDKVKAWLSSCEYRDIYEQSIRQRHPQSCQWFLRTRDYSNWKAAPFNPRLADDSEALHASWHNRVLFVQAEPGFGKTVLAGQIIDDLGAEAEVLGQDHGPPTTAFFYFNSTHSCRCNTTEAFRALASQLVHAHRTDRRTLDALALLMRKSSGQQKASSDDALAVLSILLRQHPTFLVFDGIDECNDVDLFFAMIPELCRISDCRVILLSRPTLGIPLEYQQWASGSPHVVSLNSSHNAADIATYVTDHLNQMADQGYFGISMDRSVIPSVAGHANGMFLWATLLIKYLQSPGLSPNERRVALEGVKSLQGLEALYHGILTMIERRFGSEKTVAADIFRWLSLSIKPLDMTALHTALAVTPGQKTTPKNHLLNLTDSISRLTCALVEVAGGRARFFHRSVKEYLQSPSFRNSEFSLFDEGAVHGQLAARCISYLANDTPKRPLVRLRPYRPQVNSMATSSGMSFRTSSSGDSGYKSMSSSDTEGFAVPQPPHASSPPFDSSMPFLRYASLCWPVHLSRALSNPLPRPPPAFNNVDPFYYTPWLPVLSQFLTDRLAVTTWVEASWRYNLPPNLSRLVPLLLATKSEIPPATIEGRELRWVLHGLRQLSDALNELRGDYGATLRENPSLIWQYNVQAASEGGFWPVWDEKRGCVHGGAG